ncbi:MAG: hypothetical protein M1816_003082 [Peltula sp. TS41687]|nr:MAG: hypothetical protein M1816_003082 [Peltula sp. TS41687]
MAELPYEFPPPWPPNPDLYDEVNWGPYPSEEDYEIAYSAWKLPYDTLKPQKPNRQSDATQVPLADWKKSMEALVGYIHHRLRHEPLKAEAPDPNAQNGPDGWKWDTFLPDVGSTTSRQASDITSIGGRDLGKMTKKDMEEELQKRNVGYPPKSLKADLKELLIQDELKVDAAGPPKRLRDVFPRSKLERWGLNLPEKSLLPFDEKRNYTAFELYTMAIYLSPYNPTYWTARAYLFLQQGHDDLALGDAYRALYLIDVEVNVFKRAKRPGLHPRIIDAIEQHVAIVSRQSKGVKVLMTRDQGVPYFLLSVRKVCHHIMALSLRRLRAWDDAIALDKHLLSRSNLPVYDRDIIKNRVKEIEMIKWSIVHKSEEGEEDDEHPGEAPAERPSQWVWRAGVIVPQPYPQAREDVDRTDKNFIGVLNQHYIQGWPGDDPANPTLWVEAEENEKRLKVVANRSIKKGEILYAEEPNIRGQRRDVSNKAWLINPCSLACENCKQMLSVEEVNHARQIFETTSASGESAEDNGKKVDDLKDECHCLFQDTLVPFCLGAADRDRGTIYNAMMSAASAAGSGSESAGSKGDADDSAQPSGTGTKRPAPGDEDPGEPAPKRANRGARTTRTTGQSQDTEKTGGDAKADPGKAETADQGLSCLQVARANYHYRACNKKWRWLHSAMMKIRAKRGDLLADTFNEKHGTYLSLLLREVFEMTLMKRETAEERDGRILAFEIDDLYPIEDTAIPVGKRSGFPFTWAANIVVPFDILECLGVNIFRQLDFDTWVIQTVLRKLINGAVRWSPTGVHIADRSQGKRNFEILDTKGPVHPWAEIMRDLYVHTAFTLIKRDNDEKAQNALWTWVREDQDNAVKEHRPLNRIIVVAQKDIASGEEIVINRATLEHPAEEVPETPDSEKEDTDASAQEVQEGQEGQEGQEVQEVQEAEQVEQVEQVEKPVDDGEAMQDPEDVSTDEDIANVPITIRK